MVLIVDNNFTLYEFRYNYKKMVSIKQKIAEINRKPEHVRLKFMYAAVFFCMIFVIIVWIMSVKINFSSSNDNDSELQVPTSIESLIKEKIKVQPSIEDMSK